MEANHAAIKRCWDCNKVYIPGDEVGNYTWCPECRGRRFNTSSKNIISDEFIQKVFRQFASEEDKKEFRNNFRK